MKFTTFLKAYKIILSDIDKKVRDWDRVYLNNISFDENMLQLIFSSSKSMEAGAIALRTAVDYLMIDRLKFGLEKLAISKEYADVINEINDVGKFLATLDFMLSQLNNMTEDTNNINLLNTYFDLDKNLAVFDLEIIDDLNPFKLTAYTDGKITMFSNYQGNE
jgi:hypothetical protein